VSSLESLASLTRSIHTLEDDIGVTATAEATQSIKQGTYNCTIASLIPDQSVHMTLVEPYAVTRAHS